jgi:L-ascorbate metabolism protein UlaG (beta-lactamase superfamily)
MSDIRVTWLGHGTFAFGLPDGRTVLLDPWVQGNPACPEDVKKHLAPDLMLATHGHFDHIGDAVELARRSKPDVVGIFELCHWLESKGVEKTKAMNKGGTVDLGGGLRATMVHADHSCGILDDGKIVYGGEAAGYVLDFGGAFRLYCAGDTNVFGDMKLIGELYRPDAAILPIGDLFTMGPREAAHAIRLLGVTRVIPAHWGTFDALTGTPEALREAARDVVGLEVVALKPGESTRLG